MNIQKQNRQGLRSGGATNLKKTILFGLLSIGLLAHADTTWDGSESSDWFDADNWSAGVPDKFDKTYLAGSPYPDIDGSGNDAEVDYLYVGYGGSSILDITGGATLTTYQNNDTPSYIGYNAYSLVTVSGTGSRWDISGVTFSVATNLNVGFNAGVETRGRLLIEDGGYVGGSPGIVSLWSWDKGGGNYDRSKLLIGSASLPGTLDVTTIEGTSGSTADSQLQFNHTSTNYYFSTDSTAGGETIWIRGKLEVYQLGSGTTYLYGGNDYINDYTGGTYIGDGTLVVKADKNLGDNSSSIEFIASSSTGTLRAAGSFTNARSIIATANSGALEVDDGQTLSQAGAVVGTKPLIKTGAGTVDLQADSPAYTGTLTIEKGTFVQSGSFGATNIMNTGGTFSPGLGAASISIDGDYTQQSNAILYLEIDGTTQGSTYDLLDVAGTMTLDGTIDIDTIQSFSPQIGDTFTLLQADSLVHSGATLDLPSLPLGRKWVSTWSATNLTLTVYTNDATAFRAAYGLNPDGSDDEQDWSTNGTANIFYYLFGLGDPHSADVSRLTTNTPAPGLPILQIDGGTNPVIYAYTQVRDPQDKGITYFPQIATNLLDATPWSDVSALTGGMAPTATNKVPVDSDYNIIELQFPPSLPTPAFFRVRAILTE